MAAIHRGLAQLFGLSLCAASSVAEFGLGDASQLLQLLAGVEPPPLVGSARGYYYDETVDGPRVVALPLEGDRSPKADGSPGSRVLIMNSGCQGISAIDDVSLKLKILLMLASALHAVPAAGRPKTLIGGEWGHSTTDSWDDYVSSEPRLRHIDEVRCAEGQPVTRLRHRHWLSDLSGDEARDLFDPSRPICLEIDFLVFEMRPHWTFDGEEDKTSSDEWGAVMSGRNRVRIWRSHHIMDLAASARREEPRLQGEFNVAHVRRGDFKHNCTSVERVVARMKAVDTSRPWLVMTNAEDAWLANFRAAADAAGMSHILEGDLGALKGLGDNFMRYQVLECIYGYSVHRIYTIKSLQDYCRVPGQRVEVDESQQKLCDGSGPPNKIRVSGKAD